MFLWPQTSILPNLSPEHVHVFAWDLDIPPRPINWDVLGELERIRAQRFVFPRDRDRYVCAHAAMRRVLAEYAKIPAEKISFCKGVYGKPEIPPQATNCPIYFNLSHSAGIAVLAVSHVYRLGVDVEVPRSIGDDVAEHHFSQRELLTLRNLSAEQAKLGFYRCWTSKEALLKGEGLGLNVSLRSFDVEVDPKRDPALLAVREPAKIRQGWRLIDLKPATNAVGTLALLDEIGAFNEDSVHYFWLTADQQ